MKQPVIIIFFLLATLGGCSKKVTTAGQTGGQTAGQTGGQTAGQTATLAFKDGTTVAGTITKSDTSSITMQATNGDVRTYPVSEVSSINYGPDRGSPLTAEAPLPPVPTESSASPPVAAPVAAAPPAREYFPAETFHTIPAGTTLAVRTDQSIDSQTAAVGQTYLGVVAHDVLDNTRQVAIPRGSRATLVVRASRAQGKLEGRSELVLDVAAVRVDRREYRLETSDFVERGREGLGANRRTAEFTGGGSLLGTIVGAVAGGGKGAAIGALSGAAAGATTQGLTRGKGVRIPAEAVLNFRLEAPIRIREMR
jgi:hypothetical protein